MSRGGFGANPRRTALSRAGLAVAAALVLLLGVLWYEDDSRPNPPVRRAAIVPIAAVEVSPEQLAAAAEAEAREAAAAGAAVESTAEPVVEPGVEPATGAAPEAGKEAVTAGVTAAGQTGNAKNRQEPSLSDGYWLQLGVFDGMDNAERLRNNADELGLPAHLQARVMVGPFRSKGEADAAMRRLKGVSKGIVLPPQKPQKAVKSRRRAK
jgi:DedD protein